MTVCSLLRASLHAAFCLSIAIGLSSTAVLRAEEPERVEYDRDIRPILSNKCFLCHGPDEGSRQAGLRLDQRESATSEADSGSIAIVPGSPDESALIERIFADDESMAMPPEGSKQLTDEEKELLKRWIEQGAEYQKHWAFRTVERPPVPVVKDTSWVRNPIDAFILAKLEAKGLKPSPEASRETLIRRLSFDLTGLPPTLEEIDAFVSDTSPDAYEKLVDRLLASPHFGERMALDWLDAARYGDTNGYHIDNGRDMTAWRDWVINAFNRNLPYDQFTVQQIAGDLLPNATLEQKIASGFNRNNMVNFEGGAIPEEYHTAYVKDRVITTGTVFLGLTIGCAECHDHKYDPLTQKDFYQLYAFFNTIPENGLDGRKENSPPYVMAPPSPEQEVKLQALELARTKLDEELTAPDPSLESAIADWEERLRAERPWDRWRTITLDFVGSQADKKSTLTRQEDGSVVASGHNPKNDTYGVIARSPIDKITAIKVELLTDPNSPNNGPGRSDGGNVVMSDFRLKVESATAKDGWRKLKWKTATADFSQRGWTIDDIIERKGGWGIYPEVGKPHWAIFELRTPLETPNDTRILAELAFNSMFEYHNASRFRLLATDSSDPHGKFDPSSETIAALDIPPEQRTPEQKAAILRDYRLHNTAEGKEAAKIVAWIEESREKIEAEIPTVMVMEEMPKPRDTFLLVRGQYDAFGEKVMPQVPSFLPQLEGEERHDRLDLARWLVSPEQPLTSRVTVNRYWQMIFGTGIVATANDFGFQGDLPTHPELLNWLAAEFMNPELPGKSAWDVKGLIRMIVTSSTYRQASSASAEALERDPSNSLLARGPRFRLQAEFIRDQALAVSGLLNREIGGRSVFPYQPPGLWEELATREDGEQFTAQTYVQDHGPAIYRRGMYTFWKRTSPPPEMATLDAPDRETCTVRRPRTNTPLQSLVLMNSPTYIEAARNLAERTMEDPTMSVTDRIVMAFRLATGRAPLDKELDVLLGIYKDQLAKYRAQNTDAVKLLEVGESPRDRELSASEHAAMTIVANVILNLDETITKS